MKTAALNFFNTASPSLEGRLEFMYLDVKGLVTIGVGNLIDSIADAQRLPWRNKTTSRGTGPLAPERLAQNGPWSKANLSCLMEEGEAKPAGDPFAM